MASKKEFDFKQEHFEKVRDMVTEHAGIVLTDAKQDMIYSRLVRRIRKTKTGDFDGYLAYLDDPANDEFTEFINSITTNLTSFFRENHHFELLKDKVLPELMERNKDSRKLRIWSAGCSTGMETYSIAMVIKEVIPDNAGWDVKILATDLDTNVLQTASDGVYEVERITGVSDQRFNTWFMQGEGDNATKAKVSKKLRSLVTFKQLNLLQPFPMSGSMDIIFCRNVIIYFDKETQAVLFEKFANTQNINSYMFIGHSETLYNVTNKYKLHKNTMYQRIQ